MAPKTVHTTAYPPMKAASTAPGRSWFADVTLNSLTMGSVEGSIMAATITCHATRKSRRATRNGRFPWIRAS